MTCDTATAFDNTKRRPPGEIRCRLIALSVCLAILPTVTGAASAADSPTNSDTPTKATAPTRTEKTNAYCPVMPGMLVDPNVYTDYEGKRVYFCCANCRAAFLRNPRKYLDRLPQFGGVDAAVSYNYDNHHHARTWTGRLIRPAGILTFSLLFLTAAAAYFRRKKPQLLLKWHKRLAVATLVAAALHLLLILLAH